jgi:hypothetical protein
VRVVRGAIVEIFFADDVLAKSLADREHYIPPHAAMTASSIKDGRQATRVWNLFGTFQKAVNTLGLRSSRKS